MTMVELESNLGTKPKKNSVTAAPERVRIVLEENDNIPPTGLFMGLNGTSYMIRPGEEVEVPQGLVDILDHAITEVPVIDPGSKRVVGYRKRHRFPYRRIMKVD